MESCNRSKEGICTEEDKGISIVKRREECQFIKEQLKKEYIRPLKLPQKAPLFFVRNKQKEVNGRGLEVFK